MGVTVSKHYCGDKLKSVSIFSAPESCCAIPSGCCHDESITVKIEDDFSASFQHYNFEQLIAFMSVSFQLVSEEMPGNNPLLVSIETPPPLNIQSFLSVL
ncbi:hypothetical protein DMA11_17450 [Marinilabiliaceae bacterium JC017]|nr:hypothetical protein DMA11_17450 [Marinilabiliaceae bacterium JC017]